MSASLIESLRSVRVGRYAVFDFVAGAVGCGLLFKNFGMSFEAGVAASVPIAVATHWVLGIDTPLTLQVQQLVSSKV